MKIVLVPLLFTACVALPSCTTLEKIAPHTVAGFKTNGILGALDGASNAVLVRCRTLEGEEIRVAVDVLAETISPKAESALDAIEDAREKLCTQIGATVIIADLLQE